MINQFQGENRFLSNFYPSVFNYEGWTYRTVEHFYQCGKCLHQEDFLKIISSQTPGEAKKLGQKIELTEDWEAIKYSVMEIGLNHKFNLPFLKDRLLSTKNQTLVEGNSWGDTYWGVDLKTGKGLNTLGKLLMKIRSEL